MLPNLSSGEGGPIVVGGAHPTHSQIEIDVDEDFVGDNEHLARLSMSTCIKHIDRLGGCVQVQQIPKLKTGTADEEFQEWGQLLSSCVLANQGHPPVALAYDGHLSFHKLNQFLLGQLPRHAYHAVPFFGECSVAAAPSIPLFGFKAMKFRPQSKQASAIFGCLDPKHILKAMSRGIRVAGRTIHLQTGLQGVCVYCVYASFQLFSFEYIWI